VTQPVPTTITSLRDAINTGNAANVAACFANDYSAIVPMHPSRNFVGSEMVQKNWTAIFGQISGLRARVLRHAVNGDEIWSEWEMVGTGPGDAPALLRGPVIWTEFEARIASARFYLEPVTERPDSAASTSVSQDGTDS